MSRYTVFSLDGIKMKVKGGEVSAEIIEKMQPILRNISESAPSDSHLAVALKEVDGLYVAAVRITSSAMKTGFSCATDSLNSLCSQLTSRSINQLRRWRRRFPTP